LISSEALKCIERLFSGNLCASRIASKVLRYSEHHLIVALSISESKWN